MVVKYRIRMNHYSTLTSTFFLLLLPAGSRQLGCSKADWFFYKAGDKYIIKVNEPSTCAEAKILCERLGGQSLIIPDEATYNFVIPHILPISPQGSDLYTWNMLGYVAPNAGVYPKNTRNASKMRTPLGRNMHVPTSTSCTSIGYDSNYAIVHWVQSYYDGKGTPVCEAKLPCAARPVLQINNGTILEGIRNVTITSHGLLTINCFLRGYIDSTFQNNITIKCSLVFVSSNAIASMLSLTIDVDTTEHGETCMCQLVEPGGTKEESKIVFHVKDDLELSSDIDDMVENRLCHNLNDDTYFESLNFIIQRISKTKSSPSTDKLSTSVLELLKTLAECPAAQSDLETHHIILDNIVRLAAVVPLKNSDQSFSFASKKTAVFVRGIKPDKKNVDGKLSFSCTTTSGNYSVIKQVQDWDNVTVGSSIGDVLVVIPINSIIESLSDADVEQANRLSMTMHTEGKSMFGQEFNKSNVEIISTVLSIEIPSVTVTDLEETIDITFKHEGKYKHPNCAFWSRRERSEDEQRNVHNCIVLEHGYDFVKCGCNHMSFFALVYTSPTVLKDHERYLDKMSIVGCSISAFCLAATLITYWWFRNMLMTNPARILMQLCAALLLTNISYITNEIVVAYYYEFDSERMNITCKGAAMLLHYSALSALLWMMCDAHYLHLAMIKVFITNFETLLYVFRIIAWFVPFVAIGITASIGSLGAYDLINDNLCWIKPPVNYYVFTMPVGFIMLYNYCVFAVVLWHVRRASSQDMLLERKEAIMKQLKGAVSLVSLLGMSWLFGLMAIFVAPVVFGYLFVIFNTLQGCFIFVFFCLLKPDVHDRLAKPLSRWRERSTMFLNTRGSFVDNASSSTTATRIQTSDTGENEEAIVCGDKGNVHNCDIDRQTPIVGARSGINKSKGSKTRLKSQKIRQR